MKLKLSHTAHAQFRNATDTNSLFQDQFFHGKYSLAQGPANYNLEITHGPPFVSVDPVLMH